MTGSVVHPVREEFFAPRERSGFPVAKLDPTQERKYQMAQAYLLIRAPFFADLLLSRLKLVPTHAVDIAATDGFAVYINPDTFFRYELAEQAFIIAHEVMHCVFGDVTLLHIWKKTEKVQCPHAGVLPFDFGTMNCAMDYVINAILVQGSVGKYNKDWLYDASLSRGDNTSVAVYEKLYKPGRSGGGNSRSKRPGGALGGHAPGSSGPGGPEPGRFDQHLEPGQGQGMEPEKAVRSRNEAEWRVAVAAAAQAAKAQGKLPAALDRFVGDYLEPKVSWQDRIKAQMQRRLGADGYDWTQLDEQFLNRPAPYEPICFPMETAYGCGHIVVGVDTSGSIDEKEISRFFAEMTGIVSDLRPHQLTVLWCDAKIGRHDELEEVEDLEDFRVQVNQEGTKGGGGTSFVPVFDEVSRLGHQPDLLVYLTDMFGDFPDVAPPYPVIWGSISGIDEAPFGDVIHVEL